MTTSIFVVSDLHIGSTVGLSVESFTRDDGEVVRRSPVQDWLMRCWQDYWDTVIHKSTGNQRILVINGDVVDGAGHHGTNQSVSYSPADELRHAIDLLSPVRNLVDMCFVVRGTESHVGTASSQEEAVARELDCVMDGHRHTWDYLPLHIDDVLMHFVHHGRVGTSLTGRNNAASKLASEHYYRAKQLGRKPADLIVLGHHHGFADSGITYDTRVVQLPSWQFKTNYGKRLFADANNIPDIGGLLLNTSGGSYTLDWVGRNRYIVEEKPVCTVVTDPLSRLTVKPSNSISTKLSA